MIGRTTSSAGWGDSVARHIAKSLGQLAGQPLRSLSLLRAIVRGSWLILYYRLVGANVTIRFPFKAHAKVTITGPGSVFIDANCAAHLNCFKGLSIVTLSPQARVHIGKGCNLGGVTIRCRERVTIGDRTMTAISLIQDSLFSTGDAAPGGADDGRAQTAPIAIGSNVWIAMHCIVLDGTEIPDDCVIAAGAVCRRYRAQPYGLISGNPARRSLPIDRIQRWAKAE